MYQQLQFINKQTKKDMNNYENHSHICCQGIYGIRNQI